jgi:hypothetical protein
MKTVSCDEPIAWSEIIREGEIEDIILLRDGHAVALITPFDDDDLYWYARERDPSFLESLARAREQVAQGKTMTHDELKRELGIQ